MCRIYSTTIFITSIAQCTYISLCVITNFKKVDQGFCFSGIQLRFEFKKENAIKGFLQSVWLVNKGKLLLEIAVNTSILFTYKHLLHNVSLCNLRACISNSTKYRNNNTPISVDKSTRGSSRLRTV